jgi:hypothetical protein
LRLHWRRVRSGWCKLRLITVRRHDSPAHSHSHSHRSGHLRLITSIHIHRLLLTVPLERRWRCLKLKGKGRARGRGLQGYKIIPYASRLLLLLLLLRGYLLGCLGLQGQRCWNRLRRGPGWRGLCYRECGGGSYRGSRRRFGCRR